MQLLIKELFTAFNDLKLKQLEDEIAYSDKNLLTFYNSGYSLEAKFDNQKFLSLSIFFEDQPDMDLAFKILANSKNIENLKALRFYHKGGQANGSVFICYNELISHNIFQNLEFFYIQHFSKDGCLICEEDDFGSVILKKMPKIKKLHLVSAPNSTFFESVCQSLEILEVCGGYCNNRFLINLQTSNSFPNLTHFCYKDINKYYTQTPESELFKFEEILNFMDCRTLPKLEVLSLMELNVSQTELEQLKNTFLGKQVKELKLGLQEDIEYFDESYVTERDWFVNNFLYW